MQNNLRELYTLLSFLHPSHDIEKLEEEIGPMDDATKVPFLPLLNFLCPVFVLTLKIKKLHSILKPHLLRRVNAQVLSKDRLSPKVRLPFFFCFTNS